MNLESVESGGLEGVTLGPQRSLYSHPDVITSEGGFYLTSLVMSALLLPGGLHSWFGGLWKPCSKVGIVLLQLASPEPGYIEEARQFGLQ